MSRDYLITKTQIPTGDGEMKLLILQPKHRLPPEKTPAVLWIHGGGYATGMASMVFFSRAMALVKRYGAVVITPEYRLSPKAPYPAALKDCYAALVYLKDRARQLGCNPDQIMVGGESAGGGLTAALCMYARDKGAVRIAYQMPLYPMLDDRDTDSSRNNHRFPWNTQRNHAAWKKYLRELTGPVPAYAAPARQTDYTALPPAYTFVGNKEPFYCETVAYIQALKAADVSAELDVYPSGFHAFDMLLPFRKLSRQAIAAFEARFLYAREHYFASQPDCNS